MNQVELYVYIPLKKPLRCPNVVVSTVISTVIIPYTLNPLTPNPKPLLSGY